SSRRNLDPRPLESNQRSVGVEPTHPPWQGSRLPLHHERRASGRIVKEKKHQVGVEPTSPRYGRGVWPPDQCAKDQQGTGGIRTHADRLRAGHAAANTSDPTDSTRRESNPRPALIKGPFSR